MEKKNPLVLAWPMEKTEANAVVASPGRLRGTAYVHTHMPNKKHIFKYAQKN